MKKLHLLIILAFAAHCLYATADTIKVNVAALEYASDFEREQFRKLDKEGTFNPLNFLYCLDSSVTPAKAAEIERKLTRLFDEKIGPAASNKNTDKALKAMFKQIHDNLLTKYVLESRFEMLLDKGEYNCVTASALYALAFEKYGIPYQLRSTTDHVYVIANPGPTQMMIETTDPIGGAFTYSEAYKKTYVDMLKKQKLISKIEYDDNSTETLFQKYYYKSDTINMRQLISYHYSNDGVWLMKDEKFNAAVNQLMKAYYLNKNSQIAHLLIVSISGAISKNFDITDSLDLYRYFDFLTLRGEDRFDDLFNDYVRASEDILMHKDDPVLFDQITNRILSRLTDSTYISKFNEHYYFAKAVAFATKSEFIPAFENISKAYCINAKNVRVKSIYDELSKHLLAYIIEELDEEQDLDSVINKVTRAGSACNNGISEKWKFNGLLIKTAIAFDENNVTKGNQLLNEAEKLATENKLTGLDGRFVAMAYSGAHRYYYKKYEITKAKDYLLRGLKLDPDNEDLKGDLKYLESVGSYTKPSYSSVSNPPPPPPPFYYNTGSTPRNTNTPPTKPRTVIVKTPK
ncbi:MAG TPA: hypothetical protein PLW44_00575 [Chitinophagales bacterium]|nr:hypothetical protein [Chitinophagales bacterium]